MKAPSTSPRRAGAKVSRRALRAVWGGAMVTIVLVVLGLFVFPTRTLLDQRHQLSQASQQLHLLSQQNASLSQRIDQLHTDAEIERIAREQYHLVRPGEQAFAILPAPAPTTTAAGSAAGTAAAPPAPVHHAGFWHRAWHSLTSWM